MESVRSRLFGTPGEPVPAVDPENVKRFWQMVKELEAVQPGETIAITVRLMERTCKPGADVRAVRYRTGMMEMMTMVAPKQMAEFMREGEPSDAVFRAAATVSMTWMGIGAPQKEFPFDTNEFLALCGCGTQSSDS